MGALFANVKKLKTFKIKFTSALEVCIHSLLTLFCFFLLCFCSQHIEWFVAFKLTV